LVFGRIGRSSASPTEREAAAGVEFIDENGGGRVCGLARQPKSGRKNRALSGFCRLVQAAQRIALAALEDLAFERLLDDQRRRQTDQIAPPGHLQISVHQRAKFLARAFRRG
jgi:hypothetical protein